MDLHVLFVNGAITWGKMTGALHHALRAMMQFPVIFSGDTPSPDKQKMNSYRISHGL
jgi:hypothetical protein